MTDQLDAGFAALADRTRRGLVASRPQARRRLVHLEADALRTLPTWVEHYAQLADQRYRRLDAVLAALNENDPAAQPPHREERS